ncbi:MAG: ADP-forming succinate--CoA ligase subunit beta [Prolixibacteraceae bacterium]|nr:ADP-forming succinate--CoA ligase subunit beta [Prolixibacteraceae bacterium]
MKLYEYQSKALLRRAGLPVPASIHVEKVLEVESALSGSGINEGVVKAQAFTGGRGKAGGVKFFRTVGEARSITSEMIGMQLVTRQTGPGGVKINSVLLEEASEIEREYYVAILLDRAKVNPVIMVSPDGGMEIEEVAEKTPERILRMYPEIGKPLSENVKNEGAEFLGLQGSLKHQFGEIIQKLYNSYMQYDATLVEINPLALTKNKGLMILDCKFDIDDNAVFRQLETGGNPNAEKTKAEIEAASYGLNYISLDGNIGCMVNGAGLAMATMDSIKFYGGHPANFLDVGGSANEEAVAKAFSIIVSDPKVECILVNIFGGIMQCDTIANGIISAVKKSGLKLPLVVRLEGTNVEIGKKLIQDSGLNIISASDLDDGAKKAVSVISKSN